MSVHEAAQPVDVQVPALPALPAASQRGRERTAAGTHDRRFIGIGSLRYALRKHVHRLRVDGRRVQRTLLVGPVGAVEDLAERLGSAPHHAYQVSGACLTPHEGLPERRGKVPVLGEPADVASAVSRVEADTMTVLACPQLDGHGTAASGVGAETDRGRPDRGPDVRRRRQPPPVHPTRGAIHVLRMIVATPDSSHVR